MPAINVTGIGSLTRNNLYEFHEDEVDVYPVFMNEIDRIGQLRWNEVTGDQLALCNTELRTIIHDYIGAPEEPKIYVQIRYMRPVDIQTEVICIPRLAVLLNKFFPVVYHKTVIKRVVKDSEDPVNDLKPWQQTTHRLTLDYLNSIGFADLSKCWLRCYDEPTILYNYSGVIQRCTPAFRQIPGVSVKCCQAYRHVQQEIPSIFIWGAMVTEATGTGKSRVTAAIVRDMIPHPGTTIVMGRIPTKTAVFIVLPNTLTQWKTEIKSVWPTATIHTLTNAREFRGLHNIITTVQPDILLVNANIMFSNRGTRDHLICERPTEQDSKDWYVLRTIQFSVCVIDEAQSYLEASAGRATIGYKAYLLKSLFHGTRTIFVTATPGLHRLENIDTYLYLSGVTGRNANTTGSCAFMEGPPDILNVDIATTRSKVVWAQDLDKLRSIFIQNCVVHTGAKTNVKISNYNIPFYDSSYSMRVRRGFNNYYTTQTESSTLFGGLKTIYNRLVDYIEHNSHRVLDPRYQLARACIQADACNVKQLGKFQPSLSDEPDIFPFFSPGDEYTHLTPIQTAATNCIRQLVDNESIVLIYTEHTNMWKHVELVLKSYNITTVYFRGSVGSVNKKRKTFDEQTSRTIMLLHETDGISLPNVSHVVVVGRVDDMARYKHMIGRVDRLGRCRELNIVHLQGIKV
jgi:hypothetical protein